MNGTGTWWICLATGRTKLRGLLHVHLIKNGHLHKTNAEEWVPSCLTDVHHVGAYLKVREEASQEKG